MNVKVTRAKFVEYLQIKKKDALIRSAPFRVLERLNFLFQFADGVV